MASKSSAKKEFDWRDYSRPERRLSEGLELALQEGHLGEVRAYARSDSNLSLQIRADQATLYYRGFSLLRIRDAEEGLIADVDANLRLRRAERASAERLETVPARDATETSHLLEVVDDLRKGLDRWSAAGEPPPSRSHLLEFLAANAGRTAISDELLVVDIEYPYGRRKFDFVALRRAPSVGGAAAFTTPRLVLGDLRYPGRTLGGSSRPSEFGSDAGELAHALSGEHLARVRAEVAELTDQKQRLGLLPADIPFDRIAEGNPDLLEVFTDPTVAEQRFDAPLAELHDKLIARRFPVDHLRFAAVGAAREGGVAPGSVAGGLTVESEDVLDYRAFKALRKRRRA